MGQIYFITEIADAKGKMTIRKSADENEHREFHKNAQFYCMTVEYEEGVNTPMGPLATIVAISNSKNPKNNKAFETSAQLTERIRKQNHKR